MKEKVKKILTRLRRKKIKKHLLVFVFLIFVLSFFVMVGVYAATDPTAKADIGISGKIILLLSIIISGLVSVIGKLLIFLIHILLKIVAYNHIIDIPSVRVGWVIVRDIANMFFIVILLVIAFATILRIEGYQVKKLLPKLIIMAVLINFSKTIAGFIVDISQVIMLQFASAISPEGISAEGNFINIFQINEYTKLKINDLSLTNAEVSKYNGVWGLLFVVLSGLIALLIAIVAVLSYVMVLIMRVAMLWIYVILSPFAYLLAAIPAGQKYASQWWGEFTKYVITGPIAVFFLWLALYTTSQTEITALSGVVEKDGDMALSAIFETAAFQRYLILIALLIGGLKITQQVGGTAGSAAGWGMGKINAGKSFAVGMAKKGARKTAGIGASAAKGSGKFVGRQTLGLAGKGLSAVGTEGSLMAASGKFATGWKSDLDKTIAKKKENKRAATLKKLGMGDNAIKGIDEMNKSDMGQTLGTLGNPLAIYKLHQKRNADQKKQGREDDLGPDGYTESKERERVVRKDLDGRKEEFEKNKVEELAQIDNKKESEISRLRKEKLGQTSSVKKTKDKEIRRVAENHEKERLKIESTYSDKEYEKQEQALRTRLQTLVASNKIVKEALDEKYKLSSSEEKHKKYDVHAVTTGAIKETVKHGNNAKNRVNAIGESPGDLSQYAKKGIFYNKSGFNSGNSAMMDKMADGSNESEKMLKAVVTELKKMSSGDNKNFLTKEIKESLAAREKKGDNMANLQEFSIEINNMSHGGENGNRTSDDMKEHVIVA